ncbi:MAG TPA: hypothetical protein VND66_02755 [Acidobacteriaceae bacterium]|nr:hypothetical protein [Acidobacteriaceae bacterium]
MTETGNVFVTKEIMGHSSTAAIGRYQHPALAGMAGAINARNVRNQEKVTKKLQSQNAPKVMQASY